MPRRPARRKTRVVKILSPEYFELLKKDATFAQAQQLGWALSINVGAERIVVEKDGKQKDESLKPKAPPAVHDRTAEPGPGNPGADSGRSLQRPNRGQTRNLPVPPNRCSPTSCSRTGRQQARIQPG